MTHLNGPWEPIWMLRLQQATCPLAFLDECASRYGEPFLLNSRTPKVYVSDPVAIRTIFTADSQHFRFEGSDTLRPLLGNYALVSQNGIYHHFQRRLQAPWFFGNDMKARWGPLICTITRQMIEQWSEEHALLLRSSMQDITLRVIVAIVLGWHDDDRSERLIRCFKALIDETLGSPARALCFRFLRYNAGSWNTWGRFLHLRQQLDEMIDTAIKLRRSTHNESGTDILSSLLTARNDTGSAMTNEEIRDHLVMLLFAGHETTASALAWSLYWLHQSPESCKRLFRELDTLSQPAESAAIDTLPYLTAVCEETLRITPIAAVTPPRIVVNGFELVSVSSSGSRKDGRSNRLQPGKYTFSNPQRSSGNALGTYHIEPGTELLPCIYLAHHRAACYPEPKRFLPERFLGQRPSPYEYFPFGGGNHRCLGAAFALFEMKLVLATLLSSVRFTFPHLHHVTQVSRGGALGPPEWLQVQIARRRPQAGY